MTYVIDGHNLIPKIRGLSLKQDDDEMRLVKQLQEFCRVSRKKAEVFFDDAPPGVPAVRKFGSVTAHFVPVRSTADAAIRQHLVGLGRAARNVTLVSSDHMVQAEARRCGARVISSEEFASQMAAPASQKTGTTPEKLMSNEELQYWTNLFQQRDNQD